jgi:hypothetical protein
MMHQIVDLDGYSSLEIGLRIAAKYRARWRYIPAVAVGEAAGNAMVPSKALDLEESTRASCNSEAAGVAINGSIADFTRNSASFEPSDIG